jgi:2-amino-4-hydroxy-6-hydroxymethyldihydropteridine diphosphokinase
MIAYLALGSNLGDRAAHLAAAVRALAALGRVAACSGLYETRPEGGAAQPDYVNAVVRLETGLSPRALLDGCLAVERGEGRVRPQVEASTVKPSAVKASRTLDIDVLLCDGQIIDEPGLTVPHPRLLVRPFVRIPLAEVALPGLCHPQTHEALATAEPDKAVRKLGPLLGSV